MIFGKCLFCMQIIHARFDDVMIFFLYDLFIHYFGPNLFIPATVIDLYRQLHDYIESYSNHSECINLH